MIRPEGPFQITTQPPRKLSPSWLLPVAACVFCVVTMLGIGHLGGSERLSSLLAHVIGGVIGIVVAHAIYIGRAIGSHFTVWAIVAFLVRVTAGVVHNQTFLDPAYFQSKADLEYLWDYVWMDYSMKILSNHWEVNGVVPFYPHKFLSWNKNPFILSYAAQLYYWNGSGSYLNIVCWNSMHTVLTAIVMGALCVFYGKSPGMTRLVVLVTLFEPFGFFSNIFWRDTTGRFFIVLAGYLLAVAGASLPKWVLLAPASALLCYFVRGPYLLLALGASITGYLTSTRKGAVARVLVIVFLMVLIVGVLGLGREIVDAGMSRHKESLSVQTFTRLPFRVIRALTGPFPWSQYFRHPHGWEFQPADYMQFVLNMAILVSVLPPLVARLRSDRVPEIPVLLGLMLFMSGCCAPDIHCGYVSAGMPLILLGLDDRANVGYRFVQVLLCVFATFLITNTLYSVAGLEGSGILRQLIKG